MDNQDIFKKLAKKYPTPQAVQKFVRLINYHTQNTMQSALCVLQNKKAHCLEGAFVAAAILEHQGFPPLVLSMESQDRLDHVVYLYKQNQRWGSIGQSRDEGLYGRPAIYRSIRDLVWSYFDPYIDNTGKITAYQIANLDDSKSDWRFSKKNVWKAENYLLDIQHRPLPASEKRYFKVLKTVQSGQKIQPQYYWW